MWEVGLKLLANPQEVGVDGVWLDVVTHINCEKAEGVGCVINGHVVYVNEGKVRVQSRSVVLPGTDVNCLPKSDCLFSYQMFP